MSVNLKKLQNEIEAQFIFGALPNDKNERDATSLPFLASHVFHFGNMS